MPDQLTPMQMASAKEHMFMYGKPPDKLVKPVRNQDGTYSTLETIVGEQYTQVIKGEMNKAGLIFPYNSISGDSMPAIGEKVNYGRLVRIPSGKGYIGGAAYYDVTVKDAKAEAKRLRKLARQIEKACR